MTTETKNLKDAQERDSVRNSEVYFDQIDQD